MCAQPGNEGKDQVERYTTAALKISESSSRSSGALSIDRRMEEENRGAVQRGKAASCGFSRRAARKLLQCSCFSSDRIERGTSGRRRRGRGTRAGSDIERAAAAAAALAELRDGTQSDGPTGEAKTRKKKGIIS